MVNENRLIDANALGIGKAKREAFDNPAYADGWNSAIEIIENAPTVDAVEVVHGRWLESEGTVCSVCNKHFFTDGPLAVANYRANYCPNCGAKMDGGVENV